MRCSLSIDTSGFQTSLSTGRTSSNLKMVGEGGWKNKFEHRPHPTFEENKLIHKIKLQNIYIF